MSETLRAPRSRELPTVVRFRHYARYERVNPEENCQRFYALS